MDGQKLLAAFSMLVGLVARRLKDSGWASVVIVEQLTGAAKQAAQEVCYGPEDRDVD